MLISLIAWIYLSIICLIWGHMFLSVVAGSPGERSGLPVSLVCLAGLATISTLGLLLDLFIPLDWKAHLLLLAGALFHLQRQQPRKEILSLLGNTLKSFSPLQYGILSACIAMVLLISVHVIAHPDTLIYHARSILLFQRYTTIPGIANLMPHFGFQSGWFAALALSNPTPWYHLIFLNGAVLCWFFIFVIGTWNKTWLGWLLLAYTLLSWVQVRLTAASASPDFIVTIYSLAAFFTYLKKEENDLPRQFYPVLTILFCLAAILTKLSVITLLLLAAAAVNGNSKTRAIRNMIFYAMAALVILFIRNVITSGYLLYPASKPDIFPFAWKMSLARLEDLRLYITRYATIPFDGPMGPLHISWIQKVTAWWSYIDYPDRILLLAILAGLLANITLAFKRRIFPVFTWNKHTRALLVTLIGSTLWLWSAPSPRFGTGFLVPLLYLLFYHLPQPALKVTRLLPLVAGACLFTAVSAYTIYRCIHFLAPSNIVIPSGIAASAYEPLGCDDLQVDLLHDSLRIIHPATPHCSNDFSDFTPRGRSIREGFTPD